MDQKSIELRIDGFTPQETERVQEILSALVSSGGLFGVKGGQTVLHFDPAGVFMGVELRYWPWRRRPKV